MMKYDIAIVGAGPAGIFTALEMLKKGSNKKIVIVEKGHSIKIISRLNMQKRLEN